MIQGFSTFHFFFVSFELSPFCDLFRTKLISQSQVPERAASCLNCLQFGLHFSVSTVPSHLCLKPLWFAAVFAAGSFFHQLTFSTALYIFCQFFFFFWKVASSVNHHQNQYVVDFFGGDFGTVVICFPWWFLESSANPSTGYAAFTEHCFFFSPPGHGDIESTVLTSSANTERSSRNWYRKVFFTVDCLFWGGDLCLSDCILFFSLSDYWVSGAFHY